MLVITKMVAILLPLFCFISFTYFSLYFLCLLQNDKRYLTLECVPEDREKILMMHLEEMERKGPPPPPTASEPSRRSGK